MLPTRRVENSKQPPCPKPHQQPYGDMHWARGTKQSPSKVVCNRGEEKHAKSPREHTECPHVLYFAEGLIASVKPPQPKRDRHTKAAENGRSHQAYPAHGGQYCDEENRQSGHGSTLLRICNRFHVTCRYQANFTSLRRLFAFSEHFERNRDFSPIDRFPLMPDRDLT